MTSRMTPRQAKSVLIAFLLAVPLVFGACSGASAVQDGSQAAYGAASAIATPVPQTTGCAWNCK